jgi:hypothetical protein
MTTSTSATSDTKAGAPPSGTKAILGILVGALAIFGLIIVAVYFDIGSMLPGSGPPALVEGSGSVTWEGRPLGGGNVMTKPTNAKYPGAVGFLDEAGNFDFYTDVNGTYVKGIVPGKHQVAVVHYGVNYPMGAPPATPPHYAQTDTSPITIEVSKSTEQNKFPLEITGEPGRGGTIDELLGLDKTPKLEPEAAEESEAEDDESNDESDESQESDESEE